MLKNHLTNPLAASLRHPVRAVVVMAALFLFAQTKAEAQQKIQKDERLGVILSFTAPGLGQIYAGNTWRGIGIMAVEAICGGIVAGVAAESSKIKVLGVDGHEYEVMSNKTKKLSGGEVAAVATAGVAGLGIYIWQIFDARKCVKNQNKAQGFDVGMTMMENGRPGVKLQLDF